MKYDFDSITDRMNAPYQYSIKWADYSRSRKEFNEGNPLPEDRISLYLADMDFKCPPELVEAVVRTAEHGVYGYTLIPDAYFEAIRGWFAERFDWHFENNDVFPCMDGTHVAVQQCIRYLTEPGDGIILFTPTYSYQQDIEPLGRTQTSVPLIEENGYYTIDFDALEKAAADPKNTMMVFIQPHNPTGRIFTEEEVGKCGEICRKHGVILLSDEVHIDLIRRGRKCLPVMKVLGPEGVISATAINKTFNTVGIAMTNLIIRDSALKARYKCGMKVTPFGVSAVIAAYTRCADWVDELNVYIDRMICDSVERLRRELPGLKVEIPEGTYCIWLDFRPYGISDEEINRRLRDRHVMLKMGSYFADPDGDQRARVCIASPKAVIDEGIGRIIAAFRDLEENL